MTPFFFSEPLVRVALCEDTSFGLHPQGTYHVDASENVITYQPLGDDAHMNVRGIRIGRDFHWDRECDLSYAGVIQVVKEGSRTLLLDILKAESYLESVVGSEMNPHAPEEFVKAHAVIARSWLMRQMSSSRTPAPAEPCVSPGGRCVTWTQASAHKGFDVCCDDHCQRYQGLGAVSATSRRAVEQTRGLVLTDADGEIADTRYSKCCGGITELFSTCWEDKDYPYLVAVSDPFCHPDRLHAALARHPHLLKDYDMLTSDYYEWRREVTASEVAVNLRSRFGGDVGDVTDLVPLVTGPSGRVRELLVRGTGGEIVIGKELSIRRLLSSTHLYSSAFTVRKNGQVFVLEGRGWGHGVGLCQIGAAVMAVEGFRCEEILARYYPNTRISRLYD